MARYFRSAAVILGLCLSLFILGPTPAQAIPVAGDYMFTSGLTGTFTSDGSQLTQWAITDTNSYLWSNTDVSQLEVLNNSFQFWYNNGDLTRSINISWSGPSVCNVRGGGCESPDNVPISYQSASVTIPGTVGPFALGFLALVAYEWRQRRQAEMQVV